MSDLAAFAAECDAASKSLRRLPKDVRRALASDVKSEVAAPLADKIGAASRGPYGRVLAAATKARASADPQIVVGGARRVVSGGASARQLVYGTEFGGGGRTTAVPAGRGHKAYRRRSTNQFRRAYPFVFPTIGREGEWVLDRFADIVLKAIDEGMSNG